MVATMNKIKANNWTDAQWFNFICGIIRSDNFSGNNVPKPIVPENPSYDSFIIYDYVIIEKSGSS